MPRSTKLGRVIAEREYQWRRKEDGGNLHIRFGMPRRGSLGGREWVCPVEFTGGPPEIDPARVFPVYGVDALQTIQLALRFVHGELAARAAVADVTWYDQPQLGFDGIQMFPGVVRSLRKRAKPQPRAVGTRKRASTKRDR